MQGKPALILALAFALLGAVFAAAKVLRAPGQHDPPAQRERPGEADTPVVDFNAPAPADPKERALRRARSGRYDYAGEPGDAGRFLLNEQAGPVVLDLPASHAPKESPLPVQAADAIVVGTITDARAYLSNDKTNIYSEFNASLEEVLFNGPAASLSPGTVITTERRGGTVRFPSGKTLVRGELGRTMPRKGRRYLLFLRRNEAETFSIITGYELRNGKVLPLDGLSKKNPQLSRHAAYAGVDETAFLNQVREIISRGGEPPQ
jgi:hypothetical protein